MDKQPLISILMNCFNGEKYLEEALKSIIQQSYKNWELIFWDNKSHDKSIQIVSSFKDKRIKIYENSKHTNLGKARKSAFSKTNGDYLAFLDVDDIWHKEKLSTQIKVFNDDRIGASFTNSLYFSKRRKKNLYNEKAQIVVNTKSLITNYPLSLVSIMIDIRKLKNLEYIFDENYSHISDFDLIVRLSTISKVKYLNKVLSGWRIHGNNESFKKKELFNKEKEKWCDYHLKNKYLKKYLNEISELKLLTLAENRILNYHLGWNDLRNLNSFSTSSKKNLLIIVISYIPIFPKILYKIKNYIFRYNWL